MIKYSKFTEKQKQVVVDMYARCGSQIPEIIESCDFSISKASIYSILHENNVSLIRKTAPQYTNIVGKKFGRLTVNKIAQTEKSGKNHRWRAICNCDCGNQNLDIRIQTLVNSESTSCGCDKKRYLKITGKNNVRFTGCEELSGRHWGRIVKQAEERGFEVNITIQYAWDLYLLQNRKCALSGLPIKFTIAHNKNNETASLDRIDSSRGYVEGNVQWLHKHINMMKGAHEQNYFISLCKLVAEK